MQGPSSSPDPKKYLDPKVLTKFTAEAEGITPREIVERLLRETPVNESKGLSDARAVKLTGS